MAIKVTKFSTQPELQYNNWFLESLQLTQEKSDDDTATPVYKLIVHYRYYAIDSNNKRYYTSKVNILQIDDYLAEAVKKMLQGDWDLMNAAGAIQLALAQIAQDQLDVGTAEVY